jgi:hypothetical protein
MLVDSGESLDYNLSMSWHVNTFVCLFLAVGEAAADSDPLYVRTLGTHKIYSSPRPAGFRGIVPYGGVVEVLGEPIPGKDCAAGWARVTGEGYMCMERTQPVDELPGPLPPLLEFIPQDPEEVGYGDTGHWEPQPLLQPFMPSIHARISEGSRGRLWSSAEDYGDGARPNWRLKEGRDYRFVAAVQTERGWVLERPNGRVSPVEEWYVYPVSRFFGRELSQDPVPAGQAAAWAVARDGAPIRVAPKRSADLVWEASFQESLNVVEEPVDGDWYIVPNAMGQGRPGYIHGSQLRRWQPADRPSEVQEDELWVDVHLEEQTLGLYLGDDLLYVTLVSTARQGFKTPAGLYRIYSKAYSWDLASLEGADDPYYMEEVPWVMHYYPRYAIHSAYWHADYGLKASHGCINMSPKDVRYVFGRTGPSLPDGWKVVRHSDADPGTIVRIRNRDPDVPDRRVR